MEKFNCTLSCGHNIEWEESPLMPGADLPWIGRIIYCSKCELDKEIEIIDPAQIIVNKININNNIIEIFYDASYGTWGYTFDSIFPEADITGFESQKEAEEHALKEI